MKHLLLIALFFFSFTAYTQLSIGTYYWEGEVVRPDFNYVKLSVEILDVNTFKQTEESTNRQNSNDRETVWNKSVKRGQILSDKGYYVFLLEDSAGSYMAKINGSDLIIYGYKQEITSDTRKLKGIRLKKPADNN
jgi:hypothetical protein